MIKARTMSTGKPTWISVTVKDDDTGDSSLRSGESVFHAVKLLRDNMSALFCLTAAAQR